MKVAVAVGAVEGLHCRLCLSEVGKSEHRGDHKIPFERFGRSLTQLEVVIPKVLMCGSDSLSCDCRG